MSKSGSRGCSFLVYSVSCFIFLPLFLSASTSQKYQEFSAAAREVLRHTSMYQYNCLVMAIINSSTCSPSPSPSSSSFHGTSICKRATLKQPTLHSLNQFSSIPKSYRRSRCPELKEDGTALLATSFGIRAYKDATTTDVAASYRFNILPRLCIILRLHKPRTQLATMLLLSSNRHTNRRRRRRMHPSNSRTAASTRAPVLCPTARSTILRPRIFTSPVEPAGLCRREFTTISSRIPLRSQELRRMSLDKVILDQVILGSNNRNSHSSKIKCFRPLKVTGSWIPLVDAGVRRIALADRAAKGDRASDGFYFHC